MLSWGSRTEHTLSAGAFSLSRESTVSIALILKPANCSERSLGHARLPERRHASSPPAPLQSQHTDLFALFSMLNGSWWHHPAPASVPRLVPLAVACSRPTERLSLPMGLFSRLWGAYVA
jgi:hypothetical protein